ncbi:MAG: putative toxin-antitoxin system toxin component, PIN family [Bryobacteraceae bacterium]
MIRVVIDTNVVVSSLIAAGTPKAVLQLAFSGKFAWYVSRSILAEYKSVLAYPRLEIDSADAKRTVATIREHARIVSPGFVLGAAVEEEDNRFLECAQASKANCLITGNLRHFPEVWKYTRIVPPKEFLRLRQMHGPLM